MNDSVKIAHTITVVDTVRVRDTTRVEIMTYGDTTVIREYHNMITDNIISNREKDTVTVIREKEAKMVDTSIHPREISELTQILLSLVIAFPLTILFFKAGRR